MDVARPELRENPAEVVWLLRHSCSASASAPGAPGRPRKAGRPRAKSAHRSHRTSERKHRPAHWAGNAWKSARLKIDLGNLVVRWSHKEWIEGIEHIGECLRPSAETIGENDSHALLTQHQITGQEGEPTGEMTFLDVVHAPAPEGPNVEGTLMSLQVGTGDTDCQLWSLESSREVKEGHQHLLSTWPTNSQVLSPSSQALWRPY